jgi:hypothetical protein
VLDAAATSVETWIFVAALVTLAVFGAAWRFAFREYAGVRGEPALPRAQALRGAGSARQGWNGGSDRGMKLLQTAFIALGITSIFVMVVCAVGIVALAFAG